MIQGSDGRVCGWYNGKVQLTEDFLNNLQCINTSESPATQAPTPADAPSATPADSLSATPADAPAATATTHSTHWKHDC